MQILLQVISFIFVIFVLVVSHEFGHLIVAKLFDVKILKFSVGFGKELFSWHGKDKTKYAISLLPLGGYVKMLDTREMKVSPQELHLAFDHKPVLQRILIVLAGPFTNIIFALLVFWIMYLLGVTLPKPVIGKILPDTIASATMLQSGDEIIGIDNKSVQDWQGVMFGIFGHIGNKDNLRIIVKKNNTPIEQTYNLNLANWSFSGLEPDPLRELGITAYHPPISKIIGKVAKNTPAAKANLREGDEVISVNGKAVEDWEEFINFIQKNPQQILRLQINRQHELLNVNVKTDWKFGPGWKKIGFLGVSSQKPVWPSSMLSGENYSFFGALQPAWRNINDFMVFNAQVLGKLITGKIPMGILGGPISIFQSSAAALNQGAIVFFGFLGIFSIMLAFVNLLPIPGLDGGHVLICLIEFVRRKPLSAAVQILIMRLGIIALILLAVRASINDLLRLFS